MGNTEAVTNMIVALINNSRLTRPEEVAEAYKTIYDAVISPDLKK